MTNLSRRMFAHASFGLLAASALPKTAHTDTQTHLSEKASLYQTHVGRYRLTALMDGLAPLTRQHFFGADEGKVDAVLDDFGVPANDMSVPLNVYLLQSADEAILVDAGMGSYDLLGPGFGHIIAGLAMVGLLPSDITKIIVTHAHPDHVGGLISEGRAVFENAELAIAAQEYSFWNDAGTRAQAPTAMQPLFDMAQAALAPYANRLTLVENNAEVAPGLRLELSPGHTPGHSLLHLDGGDRELLFVADTVHNAELHTALPQTGFAFDGDPSEAAASRLRVFDRAATDKILIAGAHIHFPGFGRFVKAGDAYRYLQSTWL